MIVLFKMSNVNLPFLLPKSEKHTFIQKNYFPLVSALTPEGHVGQTAGTGAKTEEAGTEGWPTERDHQG